MPKSKSKTVADNALSLEDIFRIDAEKRLEIARQFHANGYDANVHLSPEGQVLGLGSVADRGAYIFAHLAKKYHADTHFKINQLLRLRSDEDGREYLIIQGIGYTRDLAANEYSQGFIIGRVDVPVWRTTYSGYDSRTGEIIETGKECVRFNASYYIPFSRNQVEALSKHFKNVGLLVKTEGGRKYHISSIEGFCKDYNELCIKVTPKPKAE